MLDKLIIFSKKNKKLTILLIIFFFVYNSSKSKFTELFNKLFQRFALFSKEFFSKKSEPNINFSTKIENIIFKLTKKNFPDFKKLIEYHFEENPKQNLAQKISIIITHYKLLEIILPIQHILKIKYLEITKNLFNCTEKNEEILEFILKEFMDCLNTNGIKNLSNFLMKKLNNFEFFEYNPIDFLEEILENLVVFGSKISKPNDNLRWSSYSIKNLKEIRKKHSKKNKIGFTDFNMFVKKEKNIEFELEFKKNELITPKIYLDICYIFIGDIEKHQIFTDKSYLEKMINSFYQEYRIEKYRNSLNLKEILEENELESPFESPNQIKKIKINNIHYKDSPNGINGINGNSKILLRKNGLTNLSVKKEKNEKNFAKIAKSLCGEFIDVLTSVNFQIYLFYSIKFEFLKLKNKIQYFLNQKLEENKKLPINILILEILQEEILKKKENNLVSSYKNNIKQTVFIEKNPDSKEEICIILNFIKEIYLNQILKHSKINFLKKIYFNNEIDP